MIYAQKFIYSQILTSLLIKALSSILVTVLTLLLWSASYISAHAENNGDFYPTKLEKGQPKGLSSGDKLKSHLNPRHLYLRSSTALIFDKHDNTVLYGKDINKKMPIASVTKLMMAMVIIDKKLQLNERIRIKRKDRDRIRGSKSRLSYGTILTRRDMLKIALTASENRAANALARTYPGGKKAFVKAMNRKSKQLGMLNTRFRDPAGLHSGNVSTARDLIKLVKASSKYKLIKLFTTTGKSYVTDLRAGWKVEFFNTNRLVRRKNWNINLSKTGYIADAGHCLVMQTTIANRPVIIVLLNSWGKLSKFGDSNRIKRWLLNGEKRLASI